MANSHPAGDGLYEGFSPPERLVLVMEAMARSDEAEVLRLRRSCPRKTYSGPDAAFEDRLEISIDVAAIACGDLRSLASRLRLLHWAIANVRYCSTLHHINADLGFVEGVRCAQGLPPSPYYAPEATEAGEPEQGEADEAEDEDPEDTSCLGEDFGSRMAAVEARAEKATELTVRVLARAGEDLAEELKGVWDAFGHFCRTKVGVPPDRVLDACRYPAREELESMLRSYAHVRADAETVAEYREALCGAWDRRFNE